MSRYDKTRDPSLLQPYFSRHMRSMSTEGLNDKAHIAAELAAMDIEIDETVALVDYYKQKNAQSYKAGYYSRDREVRELKDRVHTLEEAMQYYASGDVYKYKNDGFRITGPAILDDEGEIARQALWGE